MDEILCLTCKKNKRETFDSRYCSKECTKSCNYCYNYLDSSVQIVQKKDKKFCRLECKENY